VPRLSAGQRARLRALAAFAVPAWGRTIVAIGGSAVTAHAIGLGDLAGFAVIPGVFMALSPPAGRLTDRLATVGSATVVVAVMRVLGAQASRATGWIVAGLALAGLVLGLLLMPVNYGAAMIFITSAVGCLFAAGGNARDFLAFRFVDNLIGGAVIGAIGLVLWHTSRADWWLTARLTVRSLASAARSPPGRSPPRRRT
jgi:hypothetical protein